VSVTETNSPAQTSDENPETAGAAASGSGNSGAEGGATSTADSFAAERERLTAQARAHQARADKAEQDRKDLEARLAKLEKNESESSDPPKAPTLEEVQQAARSASLTANALLRAEAPLLTEFPDADKGIFDRLDQFDSVEALRAAVETSHLKTKSQKDAMREEITAEVLKDVQEKHGIELTPKDPATPVSSGDPTIEELNAMSQVQLDALEAKNPGITARVTGLDSLGSESTLKQGWD
jgi:hypothetical protein